MGEMANHPKQFNKYVSHLLIDYVKLMEGHALSSQVLQCLVPGIYSLLDICSDFEYPFVTSFILSFWLCAFSDLRLLIICCFCCVFSLTWVHVEAGAQDGG